MVLVTSSTILEGVGDELMYTVLTLVFGIIPGLIYLLWRLGQRPNNQTIHPESESAVDQARLGLQEQSDARRNERNAAGDLNCPVCLAEAEFAVETNCGHMFCGRCIIAYWRHGHWLGAVRCPVCRQPVTILLFHFSADETAATSVVKNDVISEVNSYNRRFSGEPRPIMDYLYDLPTLLRHAFTEFFSLSGLLWMFRFRIIVCFVVALLYFISPFDIIPEAAFGILGLLDDLLVILLLAIYVSIIYRQFVEWRAQGPHEQ